MKNRYRLPLLLALLLALLFVLLLGACSSPAVQSSGEASEPAVPEANAADFPKEENDQSPDTEQAPTAELVPEPEPEAVTISLMAVGDDLIHDSIYLSCYDPDTGSYDCSSLFANIAGDIAAADIACINQETIFTEDPVWYGSYPTFASPTAVGDAIIAAGFDVVTHATNHSWDRYDIGVNDTANYWRRHPEIIMPGLHDTQEDEISPETRKKPCIFPPAMVTYYLHFDFCRLRIERIESYGHRRYDRSAPQRSFPDRRYSASER